MTTTGMPAARVPRRPWPPAPPAARPGAVRGAECHCQVRPGSAQPAALPSRRSHIRPNRVLARPSTIPRAVAALARVRIVMAWSATGPQGGHSAGLPEATRNRADCGPRQRAKATTGEPGGARRAGAPSLGGQPAKRRIPMGSAALPFARRACRPGPRAAPPGARPARSASGRRSSLAVLLPCRLCSRFQGWSPMTTAKNNGTKVIARPGQSTWTAFPSHLLARVPRWGQVDGLWQAGPHLVPKAGSARATRPQPRGPDPRRTQARRTVRPLRTHRSRRRRHRHPAGQGVGSR